MVRDPRLRWPVVVPDGLFGLRLSSVDRRAKYLLLRFPGTTAIVHLGMSGRLRVVSENLPVGKHDHVDFRFEGDRVLRLNDPRRFGSIHFSDDPVEAHWLIKNLGPEPLSRDFSGEQMHRLSRRRHQAVKMFIMNAQVVVGVGNIYANEALYRAGIRPRNAAGRVSKARYLELESAIRSTLSEAIEMGGTTLRDYFGSEGKPGYFRQKLFVYGREGEECRRCSTELKGIRLGQRATVYCPTCQH